MVKLYDGGVYLVNGTEIVEDNHDAEAILKQNGRWCSFKSRGCEEYNRL